jgi:hypothetical protein
VRIIHLPTWDYFWASESEFGPWALLWVATQPDIGVLLRWGWVVQIGEGPEGNETPFLELNSSHLEKALDTKGMKRVCFRAKRAPRDE